MKYRFIANDEEGNQYISDIATSGDYVSDDDYYLNKSNVTIWYKWGNDTTVTLSQPTYFGVNITDTVNASNTNFTLNPALIIYNVTKDQVNYYEVNNTYVNENDKEKLKRKR